MAIPEHTYQRASWEQLTKCLSWALNELQLRDWWVDLCEHDKPNEYGECETNIYRKIAKVSANINLCKQKNRSPYSVVIHEALHIAIKAHLNDDEVNDEIIVRVLEPIMYERFCSCNKKRITDKTYEM